MRHKRWLRGLQAVVWTGVFCASLLIVDRGCIPQKKKGWILGGSIERIPENIRFKNIPTYLPASLRWPPDRVYYQASPNPGWWYGLGDEVKGRGVALWLGSGGPPFPDDLQPFASCLDMNVTHCPDKWHVLSTRLADGQTIFLLTRLESEQAKRILNALEVSAH